jgi:putative hydrolase of the HAD superfamily
MGSRGLVIFDAFNTLVTSRRDSKGTFLEGLERAGVRGADPVLAALQAASQGLDHSVWSGSRQAYVGWTSAVLRELSMVGLRVNSNLARCVVPALEQLHQAPMVALRGARSCLKQLKAAGFTIAVCSNWGWDLAADIADTGLLEYVDYPVSSAQVGCRKPHPRIYRSVLSLAGCAARDAVFVGDSLRTDVLGPQRAGIRSLLLAPATGADVRGEAISSLYALPRLLSG